jgi:release factor glutamine methyltransferase
VCQRRIKGEPLSRIKGTRDFWKGTFALSPDTLDPRPETEGLIDLACAFFPSRDRQMRILDLGTGTGCLLISLLLEFPQGRGWGIDCAPGAVDVAQENARRHGVDNRCVILKGDWLEEADSLFDQPFDLIVSNPPYISTQDIQTLTPEVKGYDPVGALDGGKDGLDAFRAIIPAACRHLRAGGCLMLECGIYQEHALTNLLKPYFDQVTFFNDLAGIPRYAQGSQPRRQRGPLLHD